MITLDDKITMITGATGALGRAVVDAFGRAGARLALIDRDLGRLREVHGAASPTPLLLAVDLTRADEVGDAVARAQERFGRIDVLVNVAGGFAAGPAFHEMPVELWDRMLDINARTAFLACRAVIPVMLGQGGGGGRIVNVAARAALEGKARLGPYVASKAAVIRLTESLAAEYRAQGINVNCVLPGTIDTPQNRADMPRGKHETWVPPAALADVILFLASDMARAVHGAAIPVVGLS
jgi:NAD(P)-dependent dehydrogenase (short-subunit alcohol dehydrogenase family)